ncbi:hypothetical protein BDP27DRAFT_1312557 [Rhodocollybia butyracea]|uniref:Uncharacterized protein n=1 Tax=Rhodocollybia butyracea TaxID=206335 RepID=A0A9P5UF06_9AGAR|nr:hypothetical protein BDP27DRAFT_1312557 [Rhodocollybia butyracea]
MTTQKPTRLNASDPSIMYSPPNAWNAGHNNSMTTSQPGATAQLNFSGSFIEVYGIFPKNVASTPVSHYTLDNETPLIFTTPIGNESDSHSPFVFYEANPANGSHSLLITLESGEQLALSSIVFASSSESTTGPPPVIPTAPTSPSSSSVSTKANIGGIVGGIVSAIFVLAALAAVYVVCRRRKRRSTQHKAVTPFDIKPRGSTLSPPVPTYTSSEKEPLPEVPGPSTNSVRGSMYKPKPDSNGLPPMEYGYGKGV